MIFIDTWAWVALAGKRDQHHRRVKAQHKALQKAQRRYVTTDFVLSEVIAHLYTTLTPLQESVKARLSLPGSARHGRGADPCLRNPRPPV